MLLHVAELLEASIAERAFIGLLPGVDARMLCELVAAAEAFEALQTLMLV